jgi:hypothetical protein
MVLFSRSLSFNCCIKNAYLTAIYSARKKKNEVIVACHGSLA